MNPKLVIEIDNIDTFKVVDVVNKNKLPKKQGLYLLWSELGMVYIGSTSNLYNRLIGHEVFKLKKITKIYYKEFENWEELENQEKLYIYFYHKKFNNYQTTGTVKYFQTKEPIKEELARMGDELDKISFE